MVEPLSGLGEGEMAEVVWIISEADVREMLGRSGFLYGEVLTCLLKNPARQLCVYRIRRRVVAIREEYTKKYLGTAGCYGKIDDCEFTIVYFLSGS